MTPCNPNNPLLHLVNHTTQDRRFGEPDWVPISAHQPKAFRPTQVDNTSETDHIFLDYVSSPRLEIWKHSRQNPRVTQLPREWEAPSTPVHGDWVKDSWLESFQDFVKRMNLEPLRAASCHSISYACRPNGPSRRMRKSLKPSPGLMSHWILDFNHQDEVQGRFLSNGSTRREAELGAKILDQRNDWEHAFAQAEHQIRKDICTSNARRKESVLSSNVVAEPIARASSNPTDLAIQSTTGRAAEVQEFDFLQSRSEGARNHHADPKQHFDDQKPTTSSLDDRPNTMHFLHEAMSQVNQSNHSATYDKLSDYIAHTYSVTDISLKSSLLADRASILIQRFIGFALQRPSGPQVDPNVQIALGILFFTTGEFQKAADCFSTAIASLSCCFPVSNYASVSEHALHVEAQKAPASQFPLWKLYNSHATCLTNLDFTAQAVQAYKAAAYFNPDSTKVRYNLALLYLKLGRYRETVRILLDLISLPPTCRTTPTTVTRGDRSTLRVVRVGSSHGMLQEVAPPTTAERVTASDGEISTGEDELREDVEDREIYNLLRRALTGLCRWDLAVEVEVDGAMDKSWMRRALLA